MIIEQSKTKVFLLSLVVFIHAFIILGSILFLFLNSIEYDNKFLELLAISIVLSFIIFKRCIIIDIYEYIKNLDNLNYELPEYAKDNYLRNSLKVFFGICEKDYDFNKEIDYTSLRLDILNNLDPMIKKYDKETYTNMYNRKIHYLIGNIILLFVILNKYKLEKIIPFFIIWIMNVFRL